MSQENKTLNSNTIYTHYALATDDQTNGCLNVFINPRFIYTHETEYGQFITTRPVAILYREDDIVEDIELDGTTFSIKPNWKQIMEANPAEYFVISIDNALKHFTTADGIAHDYHSVRIMSVVKDSIIQKLKQRETKFYHVDEFDDDLL